MARRGHRRLGTLVVAFVTGTLVSLGGVHVYEHYSPGVSHSSEPPRSGPRKVAPDKAQPRFGLDDADIFLYIEAITLIRDRAIRLRPDVTRAQIVEQSLRAYLARPDPCCAYLARDEYRRFRESLNDGYVGIGMEIKQERDGRTICLPDPEGPASRAGIARGTELRSLDGVRVDGKSIFSVAALARGKPGTEVTVGIAGKDGREREVRITRSAVTPPSLSLRTVEGSPLIVLSRFTRDTAPAMADALKAWTSEAPLIIDLRGNGGGDVHAAIDTAMLFLEDGKRVASVETRKGTKTYESRAGMNRTTPLYLWQDEGTASAAEVFIAALTDHERAVSIGRTTAGKATWDEIIELSDGSALVLPTGTLQTPRGGRYQDKGLKPGHEVGPGVADTTRYLTKAREAAAAARRPETRKDKGSTGTGRGAP